MSTYHDSLIHIMKTRWELEDGRVNPLSSLNADFHSLPTQLKVLIIHRLTEYRLDANVSSFANLEIASLQNTNTYV